LRKKFDFIDSFLPSSGANAADADFDISIRKGFTGFRIKQTLG
jgi:hypothetical protein